MGRPARQPGRAEETHGRDPRHRRRRRPNPRPVARPRPVQQDLRQCHTLFDTGGKVGPDLTGSNRADLAYLLENVVDPNAVIPADYIASVIDTKDGRTIIGIIKKQDVHAVTVQTANELLTLGRDEIDTIKTSKLSMMPEGIMDKWSNTDLRDAIAYLRSPRQVP